MSGLATFLQNELTTLSNEAKRKYPDIKEVKMSFLFLRFFFISHRIPSLCVTESKFLQLRIYL